MKRITGAKRPRAVLPPGGSVPRDVRLTASGKFMIGLALVFAAGALATAIIFPIVRAGQVAERAAMVADAESAPATVIDVTHTKGENPRQVITYRYPAAGREYQGTLRLRERDRFAVGGTFPIRYRRSQPARSWRPGAEPDVMPLPLLPAIPVVLLLIAVGVAWSPRRARVLLSEGRFADARVVSSTKVQHQHHSAQRVRYEFTTLSGARMTGTSELGRTAPSVGEMIPIVYHRDNPQWNAIYPLSLVTPDKP